MDVQRCAYANSLCYWYIFFLAFLVILLVIILRLVMLQVIIFGHTYVSLAIGNSFPLKRMFINLKMDQEVYSALPSPR